MNKIEIEEWDSRCSDGCCYDYGTAITVNGELITRYFQNHDETTWKEILKALGVEAEVIYKYEE